MSLLMTDVIAFQRPNYRVLGTNLRFLRNIGVAGVNMEGDGYAGGSDMSELKTWLLGKLLWDPDADDAALTDRFLQGFYGPSKKIKYQFIDPECALERSLMGATGSDPSP